MNFEMPRDQQHDCRHNFCGEVHSQLNGSFVRFETRLNANSWPAIWPTSRPGLCSVSSSLLPVLFTQLEILSFLLNVAQVWSYLNKIYLSLCILQ